MKEMLKLLFSNQRGIKTSRSWNPMSRAKPVTRSMERAGASLEKVVSKSFQHAPDGQGPLLAWPIACGQKVAARTQAEGFADGVLTVRVPDVGWRNELRALAAQYLAVVNRYSKENVTRIEFVLPEKAVAAARKSSR